MIELGDIKGVMPYLGTVAAIIFAVLLARSCNRADSAEAALRKAHEAEKLADAGLPPEAEGGKKDLEARISQLAKENATFRASLQEAQEKLKGMKPKVVEVIKWRTQPGAATGPVLPPITPPSPGCPPEAPCLVRPGTPLAIEGIQAKLETRGGNRVLVASGSCLRLEPPPEVAIYTGAIEFKKTEGISETVPPPATGAHPWIAGVVVSAADGGSGQSTPRLGVGPTLGYMGNRLGVTVSITFPNTVGAAQAVARF